MSLRHFTQSHKYQNHFGTGLKTNRTTWPSLETLVKVCEKPKKKPKKRQYEVILFSS